MYYRVFFMVKTISSLTIDRSKPTSVVHWWRKLAQKHSLERGRFVLKLEVKGMSQEVEELFRVDLGFHKPQKRLSVWKHTVVWDWENASNKFKRRARGLSIPGISHSIKQTGLQITGQWEHLRHFQKPIETRSLYSDLVFWSSSKLNTDTRYFRISRNFYLDSWSMDLIYLKMKWEVFFVSLILAEGHWY